MCWTEGHLSAHIPTGAKLLDDALHFDIVIRIEKVAKLLPFLYPFPWYLLEIDQIPTDCTRRSTKTSAMVHLVSVPAWSNIYGTVIFLVKITKMAKPDAMITCGISSSGNGWVARK